MANPPHPKRFLLGALAFLAIAAGCVACSGSSADRSAATTTQPTTTTTTAPKLPEYPVPPGKLVKQMPSGFVVTRSKEGQKPPQFVVVSFDGVGWHEKWQSWQELQEEVPYHFTGFLSGTYLLSKATKDLYTGPGHKPGASSIGWTDPEDVPIEIRDLNEAIERGDEIGTHFNGHFCSGAEPSAGSWTTEQWNDELDQFAGLITNVEKNNDIDEPLHLKPTDIIGARTPCLEGSPEALFPAYKEHGLVYDSSVPRTGIAWPSKSPQLKIWRIGMALFPMHGTDRPLITMDYNFYYRQRKASSDGVTPEESAADSKEVLETYRDMYHATFEGNRAPLILGNHFNEWNNGAYADAMADFVRETCGKQDTYCVSFRDLVAWMEAQDPAYFLKLQALPPELGPRP